MLVEGWIAHLGLPRPWHLVTAEDVEQGKPHPRCYELGLAGVQMATSTAPGDGGVLVLEDSPAGIRAGKAAGFQVVAVVTSHTAEQVRAAGADWVVEDLASVRVVERKDGRVCIEMTTVE